MNYRTSNMHKSNNWRAQTDGSVAHKFLSIELEHHHEKASLLREIKRLRAKVGLMAQQRNFHCGETDRLASILRSLPPPRVPIREGGAKDPEDEDMEERGRPESRGSGTSGRSRRSERSGNRDHPMGEENDHTTGTTRDDAIGPKQTIAPPDPQAKIQIASLLTRTRGTSQSGSRARSPQIITRELRRKISKATIDPEEAKEQITKAREERKKTKADLRAKEKKEEEAKKKKEEEEKTRKEEEEKEEANRREEEQRKEKELEEEKYRTQCEWRRRLREAKARGDKKECMWITLKSNEHWMTSDIYNTKYHAKKLRNTLETLANEYDGWRMEGETIVKGKGKGKPQE